MHRSLFSVLEALAIISSASALPSSAVPYSPAKQGTTLRPIAIRDFEAASGLQRRDDSEDFSDLTLQTQSQLIYGSPGDNGQLLLANMTLYAPDGLEMIMMERFEGLTSAVDCQGDDGTMSLTFASADAYNAALQEWAHINDSDDGKFLLIANHNGCGPDDERQPYIITKVTEDQSTYTTYLTAQTAPWSDIASTYDLDFGQVTPYQQTSQIKERGLVSCLLTGSCDVSKSVTFDVSAGTKGQVSNIYSDSKFKLDCINCFTTGSFQLAGHISTSEWSLSALTLTATPQDFLAELELEATVTASNSPASLQYEKQLLSAPIPGAGISVTGIFSIGATLSYNVGFTSTIQGTATVDFGLSASIPNSARLTADLKKPDSSSATGFGGGDLTPIFDVKDMSASLALGAYSKPKLAFGVSLDNIGTADVDISVKLPEVDVTLTAAYNQAGVCSGSSSTTGITVASSYDVEVDLDIVAKLGSSTSPSWSKKLFSITEPIASQCFPIKIPGLQPSHTAIPTTASTISVSSVTSAPTHIYSPSGAPTLAPIVNGTSYVIAPSGASVPYTRTARTGTPSFTGTNYHPSGIVVSGFSASGTGASLRSKTSGAPYPISHPTSSGLAGTRSTGTGAASISSGFLRTSGTFRA